jgi:hypothetical protein
MAVDHLVDDALDGIDERLGVFLQPIESRL